MEILISGEMKQDLRDVDEIFKAGLLPWWNDICVYVSKFEQDLSMQLIPAVVIKAYQTLDLEKDLALKMANLFKMVYFANVIHVLIKDEHEGQQHNQELQFTILIGDYIFGKVLSLLLETKADHLLNMLAAMIGKINEGLIIKYKMDGSLEDVLAKTRAPIYSNAFLSAAQLAGMDAEGTAIYEAIGYNLGMALELAYVYNKENEACLYIDNIKRLMPQLRQDTIPRKEVLEELVWEINGKLGGGAVGL